jgi:NAD(P)-dependent dehydrogenase (short-subunit alcohol dehydrogenase family)
MELELSGKTAVVTGGSKGIGLATVRTLLAELGGIDVLVNNVGIGDTDDIDKGLLHNVLDLPDSAWEHTFNLHRCSALRVSRAALPSLIERHGSCGSVDTTSTTASE